MCVYIYIYIYIHLSLSLSLYIYIYIHTHAIRSTSTTSRGASRPPRPPRPPRRRRRSGRSTMYICVYIYVCIHYHITYYNVRRAYSSSSSALGRAIGQSARQDIWISECLTRADPDFSGVKCPGPWKIFRTISPCYSSQGDSLVSHYLSNTCFLQTWRIMLQSLMILDTTNSAQNT